MQSKYSDKKKVEIYERFFHQIQLYCISMNNAKVGEAVELIRNWSYAHRIGNGELSEEEVQEMIDNYIKRIDEWI